MGLFGSSNNAGKIVKKGNLVEFNHYALNNTIRIEVVEVAEEKILLHYNEKIVNNDLFTGDPITVAFSTGQDIFMMSGEIAFIEIFDPLELEVKIHEIEKMKDLRKSKRYYVSLAAEFSVPGISDPFFAVVKDISAAGVRLYCKTDFEVNKNMDLDFTVKIEKNSKLSFKGKMIRKKVYNDYCEYGVEFSQMSEGNIKTLHNLLNKFELG